MATELLNTKSELDEIDRRLLARLMRNGRATWADLAVELGLTAPAIAGRVRRLEERGVIRQFAAWVAAEAVAPVCAFLALRFERPDLRDDFHRQVGELECVQECAHLAGADNYLLKVRCVSLAELEQLVAVALPRIPGVARVRTSVVLSSVKDTPVLPVAGIT